jgi:prepilin-type N-terminal cleavage/methylation domain-containing protein
MTRENGFTLIELVMVIVILAVAAVPLFGLFTQASASLLDNERIQTAVQLAQERAESIIAQRRAADFAGVGLGTTTDVLGTNYSAYTRTVTVTQPPAGPGCPLHPVTGVSAACKEVVVNVGQGPDTLAEVTLLLVEY